MFPGKKEKKKHSRRVGKWNNKWKEVKQGGNLKLSPREKFWPNPT